MTTGPLLLGLDIGTSRIKSLLLDENGDTAGSSVTATPFRQDAERVEMSVDSLDGAVARTLSNLGEELERVAAVGIAGIAESGAPLDGRGVALGPIISWHDPRGEEVAERLRQHFGHDLDRRIGQRLRSVSSVAKLGWLVGPGGVTGVRRWLGVPELCLHHLTGAAVTECSLAARTGAYDVGECRYLPEVLDAAGLPDEVFLPVEGAGAVMGRVSPAGAAWAGLPVGIPVTIAGHDHLAGVEGASAGHGDLANSVGTAETVVARHPELPDVDRSLELGTAVTLAAGGQGWAVLSGAARSGLVLGEVSRALGRSPAELDALAEGETAADVTAVMASIEDGSPLDLAGERAGEVWNGVLHALAQRTARATQRLVDLVGPRRRVIVFGGGSDSRPWLGAKARYSELPVWRSPATEAVARGAALFAGVAAGWWPSTGEAPAVALERVEARG
ncbi:MAG: hypothetical protein KY439_04780 [Actinobacteria bacterium]|nr:hypothetical protein [Actinomycetota bacterium]